MTFAELQTEVRFILNVSSSATDQDITTAQLKRAINYAYRREVEQAKLEGGQDFFLTCKDLTWVADATTFELPADISQRSLVRITDVTNIDPGQSLVFDREGFSGDLFWKNRNTLQWGTSGPSSAHTLRFIYLADAEELTDDEDEPELIPKAYHDLISWSAAVYLTEIMDQAVPMGWQSQLNEIRADFLKLISKGRPFSNTPTVSDTGSDIDVVYRY